MHILLLNKLSTDLIKYSHSLFLRSIFNLIKIANMREKPARK